MLVLNFSLGFHKTNCEHVICFFQGRGIYNMSHGIGKKEWGGCLCNDHCYVFTAHVLKDYLLCMWPVLFLNLLINNCIVAGLQLPMGSLNFVDAIVFYLAFNDTWLNFRVSLVVRKSFHVFLFSFSLLRCIESAYQCACNDYWRKLSGTWLDFLCVF